MHKGFQKKGYDSYEDGTMNILCSLCSCVFSEDKEENLQLMNG